MSGIIAMMILVSLTLGIITLFGLIWGIKTKQFDDYSRFLDGTKFDSEDALNDAYKMEQKRKNAQKKRKSEDEGYRPPD